MVCRSAINEFDTIGIALESEIVLASIWYDTISYPIYHDWSVAKKVKAPGAVRGDHGGRISVILIIIDRTLVIMI